MAMPLPFPSPSPSCHLNLSHFSPFPRHFFKSPFQSHPRATSGSANPSPSSSSSSSSASSCASEQQGSDGEGRVDWGACSGCGKAEKRRECDGEGRIQGGIGVVPGFRWWPIKVYRPCPAFLEAGGKYKRKGQSLEEFAFGRKGDDDDLDITERLKGR